MKVMKFGGTSVGSVERIKHVAELITKSGEPTFVVLSAMSGTTNSLIEICSFLYQRNSSGASDIINQLEKKYLSHTQELYSSNKYKALATTFVKEQISLLRQYTEVIFTSYEEKIVVAMGEILSTNLMNFYLLEQGFKVALLSALDFMRIDKNGEPDQQYIKDALLQLMSGQESQVFIAQGFICRNAYGEVDNLKRGGSDYTASLIGAAISAEEIQIWTDIDGMHNNDPRYVSKTEAVHQLHFNEAAELAYFGAKILHPTCVQPAKMAGIPVRLLNTMEPDAEGTIINNDIMKGKIKAVAAKDGITAIRIKSSRMLLATGFLRKVFEIFENNSTPIDMIATSEVGVSMSIDNDEHIDEIVPQLKTLGTVTVDRNMCIVCVVGDLDWRNVGFESFALEAMKNIPVRMISYGGSNYNISFLIHEKDKAQALESLSNILFD